MKYAIIHKTETMSRHKTAYSALKQLATVSQPVCACAEPCKSVRACMSNLVGGVQGSDKVTCKHTPFRLHKRIYKFMEK